MNNKLHEAALVVMVNSVLGSTHRGSADADPLVILYGTGWRWEPSRSLIDEEEAEVTAALAFLPSQIPQLVIGLLNLVAEAGYGAEVRDELLNSLADMIKERQRRGGLQQDQ